jgi:hypothetical protein
VNTMLFRHFWIRLRGVLSDAIAMGTLIFAGLSTFLLWWVLPVAHIWRYFKAPVLICLFLWPPLVALSASGGLRASRTRASRSHRILPALPIGPRSRVTGEAAVGLLLVLVVRALAFLLSSADLAQDLFFQMPVHYGAVFSQNTLLGALYAFPLLLSWTAMPRLDGASLSRPLVVSGVMLLAVRCGAMRSPLTSAAVSLALSAGVLALVGVEWSFNVAGIRSRRLPQMYRPSPGPTAQLRRDQWLGPIRALWAFLAVVLALPHVILLAWGWVFWEVALVHIGLLLAVLFLPFGVRLVSEGAPGSGSLFNGYFSEAWATLPVRRENVVRGVYAHGWIMGGFLWLLLLGLVVMRNGGVLLALLEFPVVGVAAGVMVCEAVGDRRRGALALEVLLFIQFGLPLALALAKVTRRDYALFVVYALGLIGGVPPLVHLRKRPGGVETAPAISA